VVEWNTNLLDTSWMSLTSGIIANGGIQTVTDLTTDAPARFYRLKVTPQQP
jgi:hypothetical protein